MGLAANTRIKLGVSKPKKDAVVATPGTAAGAGEVAIWAASAVSPTKTQSIVGDFHKLYRYAKTRMKDLSGTPAIIHMPLGGSDSQILLNGTPTTSHVLLEVGADVHGGDKSHFFHRTFIRLVERWLEESKTGTGSGVTAVASIMSVGNNSHQVTGDEWEPGKTVTATLNITDPDGQMEDDSFSWNPPGDMTADEVAAAIAAYIDGLVHYSVTVSGDTYTIMPSASENTVYSAFVVS